MSNFHYSQKLFSEAIDSKTLKAGESTPQRWISIYIQLTLCKSFHISILTLSNIYNESAADDFEKHFVKNMENLYNK